MKSLLHRLIRLDYLIHLKSTGTPANCAHKIGISERSLYDYLKMLKETRDVVAKALKDGKTLDQMKQAKLLEPWKKYDGDFIKADAFLETLYNSLTGQKNGTFMKHN